MVEKRLLIVLGSMGRGGAERVISLISDYFCKKGWKVYIALLLFNKVDYELNQNVTVINLAGESNSRLKRLPGWISGIRKTVKEIRPNSILSFAARINVIVLFACMGLKQKIVISERNDPYMDGRSKILDRLTRFLYPKAKAIVFQTKRAEGYFEKSKFTNTYIIPNPISVQCKAGIPVGRKIVTVGRLTRQKNQQMLINAFSEVHKKYTDTELIIFGDGELKEELTNQITNLHIEEFVKLKGNVSNVHEQMSEALIFVLPSDYEGLSNALLEAMMMGLPCISTDCAGSDEYIVNNESGLLIPVNDKEALVHAIYEMLENDKLREDCKEGALMAAKQVEAKVILNKWYEILD